jgi:hypothetical protein
MKRAAVDTRSGDLFVDPPPPAPPRVELNLEEGRRRKRDGQARVLAGEEARTAWSVRIVEALRRWCAGRRGELVAIEDFRAWITPDLEPARHQAWGSVPTMARSLRILEATQERRPAKSVKTHAHPVQLWRVL